jgi:hypothetical protein
MESNRKFTGETPTTLCCDVTDISACDMNLSFRLTSDVLQSFRITEQSLFH